MKWGVKFLNIIFTKLCLYIFTQRSKNNFIFRLYNSGRAGIDTRLDVCLFEKKDQNLFTTNGQFLEKISKRYLGMCCLFTMNESRSKAVTIFDSKNKNKETVIRTPWYYALIRHVLDRKVKGSNLAAAKNIFQFKLGKNLFMEFRAEEKGNTHSHSLHQSEQWQSENCDT